MTDEIEDLRARVAAARERLSSDAAFARKVELRLDDLVRIVEGSLARQGAELTRAEARIAELGADLERALARAEQAVGEAARAERLARENGELKQMVMTLLEVIEGRQKSPLGAVMQKLEEDVAGLVAATAAPHSAVAAEAADMAEAAAETAMPTAAVEMADALVEDFEATEIELLPESEAEPMVPDSADRADTTGDAAEIPPGDVGGNVAEDVAGNAGGNDMEDLSEIALYDATAEVPEPEPEPEPEPAGSAREPGTSG
ncbi:hypothetical protein A8950_0567 [Dongia mobilis]|uniref:Uncharacterized protein n=1 Tax=Dongia mobilis TaxID=578943 RepID=A0A4V3DF44_9PROT|nr:hypothetical protein [Dongia mobilis]TDQ84021.1 hypothetical protein A8950_0567 [Dongia mobilis]